MPDEAWAQAALGVKEGGFGFRRASDAALAASVGSMTEARPKVRSMCASMTAAGLSPPGVLEAVFDFRMGSAIDRLLQASPTVRRQELRNFLDQCRGDAQKELDGESQAEATAYDGNPGRRRGHGLVADMAAQDEEMPGEGRQGASARHVQRGVLRIRDQGLTDDYIEGFQRLGRTEHVHRLNELRHPETCHKWLWALGKARQELLPAEEYVTAVRLRLGATIMDEDRLCLTATVTFLTCMACVL